MPGVLLSYEAALEMASDWHAARDLDALAAAVLADLLQLVEADASGWNEYDHDTGKFRIELDPEMPLLQADMAKLERWAEQHPLLRALTADPLSPPVAISDYLSQDEFHALELYRDFYSAHGIEYMVAFGVSSDRLVGIALIRRLRDFTAEERRFLDVIRRHVTVAYAAVVARTEAANRLAQLERGLTGAGHGVVLADRSRVVDSTELARDLVEEWFGPDGDGRLPAALRGASAWPRTFERPDARLLVRRTPGSPAVLVFEEMRPVPDAGVVEASGLTERELDVLAAAALGRTARRTAELLGISPRTVEKHLENARAKLGAASRSEAAGLVFGSTVAYDALARLTS
jgi:DNA-binding CsgD family transcriptional regulator